MHYLYVLKSCKYDRHYIGIATDCNIRFAKHNAGSVRSTKAYRPWKVVCIEEFPTRTDARKRELFLKKTAKARKEFFDMIDKKEMPSSSSPV